MTGTTGVTTTTVSASQDRENKKKTKMVEYNVNGKKIIRRRTLKHSGYTKTEGVQYGRPPESFKYTEDELLALGQELVEWFDEAEENLFFEQFFQKKGMYRDFIRMHINQSENFKRIIENARQIQETKLVSRAVQSRFNPAMTIFYLKNKYADDYKDDPQQSNVNRLPQPTNIIINLPANFQQLDLPPAETNFIEMPDTSKIPLSIQPPATGEIPEPPTQPPIEPGTGTEEEPDDSLPF